MQYRKEFDFAGVLNGEIAGAKKSAEELLPLPIFQAVDKTNELRRFDKSFRPPFSKGGAVEAAEASSPSADGETPFSAFLFDNQTREAICGELASLFSFAPAVSKKKWLTDRCNLTDRVPWVYTLKNRQRNCFLCRFLL